MNNQIYRQGDVLIRRTDSIPDGCAPIARDNGRIVLAYGEVTGHAHAILDEEAQFVRASDTNRRFLAVMAASGVELRHEEHAMISLPPGCYEVVQQREYVAPEITRVVPD